MDVQLYVYDLSQGLARQFSRQLLGMHIDAVYHTSIVFGGVEYFFGAGVHTSYPGQTHHGRPMEVASLGKTELPIEIILEYLEALKEVYTAESYDLFLHNCNNFSNDFAMFLVGKGIPEHITSLPRRVLETPFGQMLQPQLDRAMRGVTQAPVHSPGIPARKPAASSTKAVAGSRAVRNVKTLKELESLLESVQKSCAVIFFTSSTCPPCKTLYPVYDALAAEAGERAVLIKVDSALGYEVANEYNIKATPTFVTFLKGKQQDRFEGASEAQLRNFVRYLVESAHPPHPHRQLRVPKLLNAAQKPVTYTKLPPLDKLLAKLGPEASNPSALAMKNFLTAAHSLVPQESRLPPLADFAAFIQSALTKLPPDSLFAAYDLFRLALTDARISAFFAEERSTTTILALLRHVTQQQQQPVPYSLRITALQLSCNLFSASLSSHVIASNPAVLTELVALVSSSLLDTSHTNVRVAAASLAFNIAAANHKGRLQSHRNPASSTNNSTDPVTEATQVELLAAILEALRQEQESKPVVTGLVLALGLLLYYAPPHSDLQDLCRVMDAKEILSKKRSLAEGEGVFREVKKEILGKGLEEAGTS